MFRRRARSVDEMTDLPADLRRRLGAEFALRASREVARSRAPDGTAKLLLAWPDGATTECVMIPGDGSRRTVCLSTQVGCDVGCTFCASGIGGSQRDLSVGEVLEQALAVGDLLAAARREAQPHRLHGHGRAAGQLRRHRGRRAPAQRRRRSGHRPAPHHHQHGRSAQADRAPRRRGAADDPGGQPARPQRPAASRADPLGTRHPAGPPARRPAVATSSAPAAR